ncbi:hypothetical protein OG349_21330 [Streptomyces sp. NBC_01317]|uniref:hypothetical protein n=1 Tax=Streptomyces sp. NBC_01317 TaxID=2903822 RepID=UPI002E0F9CD5|nr:hypothetical protein OG349_21330 [Streptomyces sp. NBC_01317]
MAEGPATRAWLVELVQEGEVVERVTALRTGYRALLEMRLEPTRTRARCSPRWWNGCFPPIRPDAATHARTDAAVRPGIRPHTA